MDANQKNEIMQLLLQKIAVAKSQNAYARSIGVSEAQISNLVGGKWDKISTDMWRKIADACGYRHEGWQVVETKNQKIILDVLADAQHYANTFAIIAPSGAGKSTATRIYANTHRNSFRIVCGEFWNKKAFLSELLRSMGRNTEGQTTFELMNTIEEHILKCNAPIIILDEADKLRDEVLYFFITLYNKLEGKCGLVLCSTPYLKTRILKGERNNKKGYAEIYSRIGRRFVELSEAGSLDILKVCHANGITMDKAVKMIVDDSDGDLRRVNRLVHVNLRKLRKEATSAAA